MSKLSVAEIYGNGASLRDKVTYDFEGVDETALARAEAAIADMQGDYLVWAEQDIQQIERHCANALALPEDERAHTMRELFATAHGMKGQGGSFGFPLVTQVSDSLARFIQDRTQCGPREMNVIHVHIDALRMVISERLTNDGGFAGEKMLAGLKQVLDKFAGR